jgi:hypothetical protein
MTENIRIFDLTDLLGLVSGHKEFAVAGRGEMQRQLLFPASRMLGANPHTKLQRWRTQTKA